jgi:hypothetical protein
VAVPILKCRSAADVPSGFLRSTGFAQTLRFKCNESGSQNPIAGRRSQTATEQRQRRRLGGFHSQGNHTRTDRIGWLTTQSESNLSRNPNSLLNRQFGLTHRQVKG